ncbi:MAG: AmmeMemoRadiSam system protein A [Proteobacteria bacterium]|nr:AmmeMemoRadiSam system protein A [Pseudomonadota bacterium]MBU1687852.1 AmmeMemoRadiSam system protein A [Pseudomonadota bacterium]
MSDTLKTGPTISDEQGRVLVQLARHIIRRKLGLPDDDVDGSKEGLQDAALQEKCGVFVTLHKAGQLRGCIGSLSGDEVIIDGVRKNACHAAFNDYRFQPLTSDEIDQIDIEVSVLSSPVPLAYECGEELVVKLRPGIDGVILRSGSHSATFLPQVWEQLPEPEIFLSHLCQKAGLSPSEWRDGSLVVLTYQVQYFSEKH